MAFHQHEKCLSQWVRLADMCIAHEICTLFHCALLFLYMLLSDYCESFTHILQCCFTGWGTDNVMVGFSYKTFWMITTILFIIIGALSVDFLLDMIPADTHNWLLSVISVSVCLWGWLISIWWNAIATSPWRVILALEATQNSQCYNNGWHDVCVWDPFQCKSQCLYTSSFILKQPPCIVLYFFHHTPLLRDILIMVVYLVHLTMSCAPTFAYFLKDDIKALKLSYWWNKEFHSLCMAHRARM